MSSYFRPLPLDTRLIQEGAISLPGNGRPFAQVERLSRTAPAEILPIDACPEAWVERLTKPQSDILGLDLSRPIVMGILNVTPDSFSDGGKNFSLENACAAARIMVEQNADIIDIGGESTRPGALEVPVDEEISRTAPVIAQLRREGVTCPISIDTRKAAVAKAALEAGANLVNDVSGFTFDPELTPLCAERGVPVCLMHMRGDPATMQSAPAYDNVLLDVYDYLAERIDKLVAQGISRTKIIADPGIGFGKTVEHNLELISRIGLFHGLGVPLLLGASRKRFIDMIADAPNAAERGPGSVAAALAARAQGVQILRVHDVRDTVQALKIWDAIQTGDH